MTDEDDAIQLKKNPFSTKLFIPITTYIFLATTFFHFSKRFFLIFLKCLIRNTRPEKQSTKNCCIAGTSTFVPETLGPVKIVIGNVTDCVVQNHAELGPSQSDFEGDEVVVTKFGSTGSNFWSTRVTLTYTLCHWRYRRNKGTRRLASLSPPWVELYDRLLAESGENCKKKFATLFLIMKIRKPTVKSYIT